MYIIFGCSSAEDIKYIRSTVALQSIKDNVWAGVCWLCCACVQCLTSRIFLVNGADAFILTHSCIVFCFYRLHIMIYYTDAAIMRNED